MRENIQGILIRRPNEPSPIPAEAFRSEHAGDVFRQAGPKSAILPLQNRVTGRDPEVAPLIFRDALDGHGGQSVLYAERGEAALMIPGQSPILQPHPQVALATFVKRRDAI